MVLGSFAVWQTQSNLVLGMTDGWAQLYMMQHGQYDVNCLIYISAGILSQDPKSDCRVCTLLGRLNIFVPQIAGQCAGVRRRGVGWQPGPGT